MTRFLKAWTPAIAMCVVIFLLSQDSNSGRHSEEVLRLVLSFFGLHSRHLLGELNEPFRKFAHVLVYFLLGALTYRGFAFGSRQFRFSAGFRSLIFCAAYAATDEYHQSLVPGRGVEFNDILLDTAASLLALALIWLWTRPRTKRPLMAAAAESAK